MDRMEVKRDIYQLWLHYKTKNDEEYFRQFVRGFVSIWEEQLQLDWSSLPNWADIRPDAGPHLSRLPEELLSSVSHFMQEARSDTDKRTLNCESLSEVELLTHLLTILARNLDNIPLVASCDYVSISIGIAATVIHQLVEESAHFGEAGVSFFTSVCHLLEVLYDPYFTWRHFLRGNEVDFEKISFQPALLHVEVVPFIYDCFETTLIESYPHLGSQLIHVLGAVVSGAQHNALRAICPATVNMLMAIVANTVTPPELRYHALQCFVLMARVLLKSAPDQRQIEVGTMVQQVREVLLRGVKEETWTPDGVHAFSQIVSAIRCLLVRPFPPKRGQIHNVSYSHAQALHAHMQQLLLDCQIPDALLFLLTESASKSVEKQSMAVEVVRVFSALLAGSNTVKERLLKADIYSRLAEALQSLGDPRRPLLRSLLALACEEDGSSSSESDSSLKNGRALLILLRWLPAVPDVDQVWLAENIAKLCNASLQSRVVCSAHKVILEICALMEQHSSLSRPAVGELLGLLEGLAAHCITPLELKSIFLLLREGESAEKCPYHSQLLHAISAVARRGEHSDCHYFFDIQNDTDGLSVPGIRKWPGAGYGFSFHCWVKLDGEAESAASPVSPSSRTASPSPVSSPAGGPSAMGPLAAGSPTSPTSSQASSSRVGVGNRRRQLFNLLTSNNTGVEIFFRADGMLVVAISTKKEFLTATVPDVPLADNRWHCIGMCITMARRPFGHNQLQVFVDGTQRLAASLKFPSMSEPFTYCTIGSVVQRGTAPLPGAAAVADGSSRRSHAAGMLERAAGAGGGLLPSLMNQVPSYLSLPLPLRNSAPLDPNVKSFQAGLQDAVWGSPGCLRGQLSTAALLQDALSPPHARMLYQQGPNWRGLFSNEEGADLSELVGRLVFCFSPAACWDNLCLDLAPGNKYDGHVVATQCSTLGIKTAVNGIGGIHVVFPILEQASKGKVGEEVPVIPSSQQRSMSITASGTGSIVHPSEDLDDWEVLPSSSYADWKLELNPVSGFLSFLRNLLFGSPLNQEHLLRSHGAAILGHLLSQAKPALLDVNVLMVAQLLLEMARDAGNPTLLRALHQHVLFNFHIWSRGPFHIRIGHIQYISSVIKEDRKAFRKRYGVQFLLDTIRGHHSAPGDLVGADDGRALRLAILRLIRYYISKEVNVKEVAAIVGFLSSVKEEILVMEVLEMLILHLEGQCKDQLFLLLFEPHAADLLYCLLIDRRFSMDLKQKVLKLTSVLLRTDRVYEMHKKRLRLHDNAVLAGLVGGGVGMYPGLIALLGDQRLSMEVAAMLLDQMLLTETAASYAAALALLHSLSLADLDIKVEAARKILTTLFMRPNAYAAVAKQVGWQDCVSRLLVKRPISTAAAAPTTSVEDTSLPDLMTFDEDTFDLDGDKATLIHRSHSPSSVSRLSASVSDAASVLESEIKDVAESVTLAIGDNIQYAADNISSFMGSAYSVFRQKTVEMQESLEGLSESAVHRLKNGAGRSGSSLSERLSSVDSASASPGNRSRSSSSSEDVSSAAAESSRASLSLSVTDGAAPSAAQAPADADSDTEEQKEALRQWVALDADRQGDREEDLCYLVLNILFNVLWRGVETGSRDCWRERGQVMACINLLGLNNELHGSHLQLKLRLLEMGVQAALSDLRESASAASAAGGSGGGSGPTPPHASAADNAAQLLRWVYDLVVLDPNPDCSKKVSAKLLDGVLGLLDALLVFQEGPQEEWTEMAKLSFGVLLACAAGPQLDLCAMATAKLHALVQTRRHASPDESAYLLFYLDGVVQDAIKSENQEHYSFLMPVVKALVEKLSAPLCVPQYCLDVPPTAAGPVFYEEFQSYCQGDQWRQFVEQKVKPLHDSYKAALSVQLTEAMNTFWAECYEASKASALKRHREVAASKIRFQEQIGVPFRARAAEDSVRYGNLQSQQRNRQLVVRRQWRTTSSFLSGPRGSWRHRTPEERHWKLSHHENYSRMRLKLCPSLAFNPHTDASNLRDNTGWLSRRRSSETPLSLSSWSAAVRPELDDDALPEEDLRSLQAEPEPVEEVAREEKLVLSQECELVTLMTSVRGRLELTTTHASFHDLSPLQEDGERQDFRWPLSRLREVHLRRYNLRRSALEFFLMDQTNYFVNFTPKTRNKVYSRILGLRPPNLILSSGRSPAEMLRASGLTQKWVNREISNFDYLMQLNTIAGRSYNDLSQYPVFPWIIADYTSKELDLENPATFRDLSKPIGVVNPKNVAEVKAKYDNFEDPSGVIAKFHYGTHYSNSAGVLHYLVRVEPFTSLHIELQSGRFDVADRQFHSIPQTWKLLMDNPNDVKELTPEFFFFPEFLKNLNGFDLGLLQGTKERVNDVVLPPWATGPEDFIFKHRRALECEYVSAHLHEWIDLIFGYKQKGPKAVEALNVFYYCSYEGAVDLDALKSAVEREAMEGMINNFGQTPCQLLREPHPQRLPLSESAARQLRPDLTQHLDKIRPFTIMELTSDRDPVAFISPPRSPPRSFLTAALPDVVVTVARSGVVGVHSWLAVDRHSPRGFSFEVDSSISNAKIRKKLPAPPHPAVPASSHLFCVSHDGKVLLSGGHWDCSLRGWSISRAKPLFSVVRHFDLITCVALDRCGWFLVTGSRDTTCVVWDLAGGGASDGIGGGIGALGVVTGGAAGPSGGGPSNPAAPKPIQTLYGHDAAVTCVAIMTELDMVVSGSSDGTVNVHTIRDGQYLRTLHPVGCVDPQAEVAFLALSHLGHIAFTANDKASNSVHVYSVNGVHLGSKYVSGRVTGLVTVGENVVVVDDAGDLTISRLYGLRPIYDVPLHVPVQTIVVTPSNTHLLVPLRDGNLVVVGVPPHS